MGDITNAYSTIHTDTYPQHRPSTGDAKLYTTDMSFPDEAKYHLICRRGNVKSSRPVTDKADITTLGTDKVKATHIFIIGHRQAGGLWLSIAGATGVPLFPSTSPPHNTTIFTRNMEKTRLEDNDHCDSLIGGGPRLRLMDVINPEPSEAP